MRKNRIQLIIRAFAATIIPSYSSSVERMERFSSWAESATRNRRKTKSEDTPGQIEKHFPMV